MAYIMYSSLGDGRRGGPFPHKAGEFYVNQPRKNLILGKDGVSVIDTPYRIGKPGNGGGQTLAATKALEKLGYVGLYFTEDQPLGEDAVEIDTDVFTEEVVSGERLPEKPVNLSKIRKKELYF